MKSGTDYSLITDIGSTTTKALLLDNRAASFGILGLASAPTTVEIPLSDVRYGIQAAVAQLEALTGISLLKQGIAQPALEFEQNLRYYSTSSAGGGLQILVIGLTLFDSASSAKRCAYGAGGVILDTFAIDDKRQAMEQMLAMRNLHPDMILICGGTDGGAVSGVLKLAELVRIADPEPKFATSARIPAIFAGNKDAAPIIAKLISGAFDLHILPNIRPSLEVENLAPTQARIQQLFMENVMENAPGYSHVKAMADQDILPTPTGVFRTLGLIGGEEGRNLFAFDIGGATTDVFSVINGHFQRTVSANLGMSYSIWTVLRESGLDSIRRWLPGSVTDCQIRNYIANKCLHPTSVPRNAVESQIERAVAREALSLALEQHRQMHYNYVRVGYLDKLKRGDVEKFQLQFEFQREEDKIQFNESDIDILIGIGGIFAHGMDPLRSAQLLIDAVRPKGITEIWIDRQFVSPHLGVLSQSDPEAASRLLYRECVSKLALHIAPAFKSKPGKPVLSLGIEEDGTSSQLLVGQNELHLLPPAQRNITVTLLNHASLGTNQKVYHFDSRLAVIVDTRLEPLAYDSAAESALPRSVPETHAGNEAPLADRTSLAFGTWTRKIELPYAGDINRAAGDSTQADDVVAVNRYNPPRLYIVNGFKNFPAASKKQIEESFRAAKGDRLDFDSVYAVLPFDMDTRHHYAKGRELLSPVRGVIEHIDYNTGIMVLSEIQDYSTKPVRVNYAEKLMLKPKAAKRYLIRQTGDFVYQGDVLARCLERGSDSKAQVFVKAPATGTVTGIDLERGELTIAYQHNPLEFQAHVAGRVLNAEPGRSVEIEYSGERLEGMIAFGRECHGIYILLSAPGELEGTAVDQRIVGLDFVPDAEFLRRLADAGARGAFFLRMDAGELVDFLEFEPGVINTGNEALPLTLMLLQSFGSEPDGGKLPRIAPGANCYLNPHTRIRAGVVRPFACFQR